MLITIGIILYILVALGVFVLCVVFSSLIGLGMVAFGNTTITSTSAMYVECAIAGLLWPLTLVVLGIMGLVGLVIDR